MKLIRFGGEGERKQGLLVPEGWQIDVSIENVHNLNMRLKINVETKQQGV